MSYLVPLNDTVFNDILIYYLTFFFADAKNYSTPTYTVDDTSTKTSFHTTVLRKENYNLN